MDSLRPYQEKAVSAIRNEFQDGTKSTLLVMATGTGKTRCFTELAKEFAKNRQRILTLAHRSELIDQAAESFQRHGLTVGIEKAESKGTGLLKPQAVIASVQTLSRTNRLAQYPVDFFDLLITDEAHHATSDTYPRIYDRFTHAKHLGVTATPSRHDEMGLKNIYQTCAFQYPIQEGIADGWLCNVIGRQIEVKDMNLNSIKIVAGDFSQNELDEMLRRETVLKQMVLPTIEYAGDRPTIVFTLGVEHAHEIAACFNRTAEKHIAVAIDGRMPADARSEALDMYESGKIQFLVNVGICTEGYDHPPTACIALFRPTRSLGLLAQMIGRGTRIASGKKDCVVLDFIGVNNTVRTMTVMDVLDGTILNDAEHKKAQELQARGKSSVEALTEAKAFIAGLDAIRVKITALSTSNAFDILKMFAVPNCRGLYGGDLATLKQISFLEGKGVKCPDAMQKGEASRLIDLFIKRQKKGLATFKQLRYLKWLGHKDNFIENTTFAEASRLIGEIVGSGQKHHKFAA